MKGHGNAPSPYEKEDKMLKKIHSKGLYIADHDWLVSRFHFSFAEYYNPENMSFGVLRVLNDDIVQPATGFGTHPHNNMEIVSYCVSGELTHRDSMGNKETLTRGDIQYMSAGTGLTHSEMNESKDTVLRFLQIWILPASRGLKTQYGSKRYEKVDRHNKLLHVVTGGDVSDVTKIHQDVNIYVSEIDAGNKLDFPVKKDRQAYLVCIEGSLAMDGEVLNERGAVEITGEENLSIETRSGAHLLAIEMATG